MRVPKTVATYLLSFGLMSLAGALIYFTFTFSKFAASLPSLISEIQVTQDKLDPMITEIGGIIDPIMKVVSDIKILIPSVVAEVELIRQEIPSVLIEVGEIRKQLPSIMEEVGLYREQIPAILVQVEEIQKQIPSILEELKNIRETMVPDILVEVEAVRVAIPGYLDQAEGIAGGIEGAAAKAGEGAVQGFFTGIIKAPISIVSGLGGEVFSSPKLDEKDEALIRKAGKDLLRDGKSGDEIEWENPDSGVRGIVSIVSIDKSNDQHCVELNWKAYKGRKKVVDDTKILCQQKKGKWKIVDQK